MLNILLIVVANKLIRADVRKRIGLDAGEVASARQHQTLRLALAMIAHALEIDEDTLIAEWGVSRSTWRRWQRGEQYPSYETLFGSGEESLFRLIERKTGLGDHWSYLGEKCIIEVEELKARLLSYETPDHQKRRRTEGMSH